MYFFSDRVRYSETDTNMMLTPEAVLDYFQDCSTFHSADAGFDIETLRKRGLVWVLSFWQIVIDRLPKFGERIKIGTSPYDFKGCMGMRNFLLQTEEGEKLAYANSVWVLIDMEGKPVRATEDIVQAYGIQQKLDMEYAPRKIAVPKLVAGTQGSEEILVRQHHLDTNCHVNNGQYVRMALDLIPEDEKVKEIRAEYRKSAKLNDIIQPVIYKQEHEYTVLLDDTEGNSYALVKLITV